MAPASPQGGWCMYPTLHDMILQELQDDNLAPTFHRVDDDQACIQSYDTNIMGRFICKNSRCDTEAWSSKQIAITIRLYPGTSYNARVYYQRCKRCRNLSRPDVDHSYAERIAYRIRKWSGLPVERPPYSPHEGKPHESRLCEGCRLGHCNERF